AVFKRLRQFQVSEGLTWGQVAQKLSVSVSMLMMVKRGKRNLSAKTLYRLEQFEREATERKSSAERVVEGLMAEEGTAAQLLERESRRLTKLDFNVDYSNGRAARTLPKEVTLWKPPDEGCG